MSNENTVTNVIARLAANKAALVIFTELRSLDHDIDNENYQQMLGEIVEVIEAHAKPMEQRKSDVTGTQPVFVRPEDRKCNCAHWLVCECMGPLGT